MSPRVAVRLLVSGVVQGVGYREFVRRTAEGLLVCGWVRNLADERVEAYAEGDAAAVRAFLERCRAGPRAARVDSIDAEPVSVAGAMGFTIVSSAGSPASIAHPRREGIRDFRSPDA